MADISVHRDELLTGVKSQQRASLWLLSLTDLSNEAFTPKDRIQFQFPKKCNCQMGELLP